MVCELEIEVLSLFWELYSTFEGFTRDIYEVILTSTNGTMTFRKRDEIWLLFGDSCTFMNKLWGQDHTKYLKCFGPFLKFYSKCMFCFVAFVNQRQLGLTKFLSVREKLLNMKILYNQ